MKKENTDERKMFTFSDVNIYVVDTKILQRFLRTRTLSEHYQDWLNGRIYSKDYILNALKGQMLSIELRRAYYLIREFGTISGLHLNQNEFYELSINTVNDLLKRAYNELEQNRRAYSVSKHIDKLERLLLRQNAGKLEGKTLLFSTW